MNWLMLVPTFGAFFGVIALVAIVAGWGIYSIFNWLF